MRLESKYYYPHTVLILKMYSVSREDCEDGVQGGGDWRG
jgi:hypothetical protein